MSSVLGIISVAFSLLTSVVAITAVIVQMRSSVKALEKFETKQGEKDEKAAQGLTELLVLIRSFIAEQTIINKTVTNTLDSLITKIERAEGEIKETEHKSVESAMMVGLFADLLKRRGCVFDFPPERPAIERPPEPGSMKADR